ncbi:MAG: recombinase, partial [Aquabacterium sp.]
MTVPVAARDHLLAQADPAAPRLQRHLWLIELVRHLRGAVGIDRAPAVVLQRLRALLAALQADAPAADRVGQLLVRTLRGLDAAALFADFGFNARRDLWGELAERLRLRWLPRSADTDDAAALFTLAFDADGDADWLAALEPADVDALQALLDRGSGGLGAPAPEPAQASAPLHDALGWLISAVRASAFSAPLRRRMDPPLLAERPFEQLARAGDALVQALASGDPAAALAPATYLRTLLGRCRLALASVPRHLSEHGISMHILFECDQTRARIDRVESVVDLLLAPRAAAEWPRLAAQLARAAQERRSVRALLSRQTAMLARQAAERHAETGEHYITRNRAEYVAMLRAAAGGGLVMAFTTLAKFGIVGLALAPLWAGLGAGLNYALSFVAIQLLHFTVATKQPAMTGPALVDRLAGAHDAVGVEAFADEVAHLVRSQVAGIVGNLAVVAPAVLALQWLGLWLAGA